MRKMQKHDEDCKEERKGMREEREDILTHKRRARRHFNTMSQLEILCERNQL